MKSTYYGATAGFLSPLILIFTGNLPVAENQQTKSIIAAVCVGLEIGIVIKLIDHFLPKKNK
ncbi:MAG: hypothetical protein DWP97_08705 [Calditrichaeota bacterium]|nr:MAG: hypothetical protein DWP97_08705 [Calditrichota bacterium]